MDHSDKAKKQPQRGCFFVSLSTLRARGVDVRGAFNFVNKKDKIPSKYLKEEKAEVLRIDKKGVPNRNPFLYYPTNSRAARIGIPIHFFSM